MPLLSWGRECLFCTPYVTDEVGLCQVHCHRRRWAPRRNQWASEIGGVGNAGPCRLPRRSHTASLSGSPPAAVLPSKKHLAASGDILVVPVGDGGWGGQCCRHLWVEATEVPNTLQHTGQPPPRRIIQLQMSIVSLLGNPGLAEEIRGTSTYGSTL